MRARPVLIATLAALAALTTMSAAAEDVEVRQLEQTFFLGDAGRVHIDLTLGSVAVTGVDGRNVEAEVRLFCVREDLEKCRRRAQQVILAPRVDGRSFDLRLKRTTRGRLRGIRAELEVRIPKETPLEIDVRAGDVSVNHMASHLEVDVGAGDVHVDTAQRLVQWVKIDVGVGAADLWVQDAHIEGTGFPRSLTWRGSGQAKIEIDAGTGDIDVNLK